MGTSVAMVKAHYDQTNALVSIALKTAKRQMRQTGEVADIAILTEIYLSV